MKTRSSTPGWGRKANPSAGGASASRARAGSPPTSASRKCCRSVIKKDGRREPFDRLKILNGLKKACEKRPISVEAIETTVSDIEKSLQDKGLKEIPSTVIGEEVMDHLHRLDEVAYVRFASVYRSFKDINEFMIELKDILSAKEIKTLKDGAV